jgi:hypothetical protein
MFQKILLIESILLKWIPFLIFIPLLSWGIMLVTVLILTTHMEELSFINNFGIWVSSVITAYVLCLFKLMKG